MEKVNEPLNIQFYAYDNKLNISFLEDLVISKYNKVYSYVQNELFLKCNEAVNQDITESDKCRMANYDLYYEIITAINKYINLLYNCLFTENKDKAVENKNIFINIIKFETKRLMELKKNMKKLGDNKVDPNYINKILKLYHFDGETSEHLIFTNIHNEVRRIFINSVSSGQTIDIESLVLNMLSDYEVSEEVKQNIFNIYHHEPEKPENPKIVDFNKYKLRLQRK